MVCSVEVTHQSISATLQLARKQHHSPPVCRAPGMECTAWPASHLDNMVPSHVQCVPPGASMSLLSGVTSLPPSAAWRDG